MELPRRNTLAACATAVCCLWTTAAVRGEDEEVGVDLARFGSLDLASEWDGGGGGADAPSPPASPPAPAEANPPEIKSPTVRKMLEKGYLTPEEAVQLDKDEEARRGTTTVNSLAERLKFSGLTYF